MQSAHQAAEPDPRFFPPPNGDPFPELILPRRFTSCSIIRPDDPLPVVLPATHSRCLIKPPLNGPERFPLKPEQVPWNVEVPGYKPSRWVSEDVLSLDRSINRAGGAHPQDISLVPREEFRSLFPIHVDDAGYPRNPVGRTGFEHRANSWYWAGNISVVWAIIRENPKGIADEIFLEQRADCGLWALPGGYVDPGESYSHALERELWEETTLVLSAAESAVSYAGYLDSSNNGDQSWQEIINVVSRFPRLQTLDWSPRAASETLAVGWFSLDSKRLPPMFYGHSDLIVRSAGLVLPRD